MHHVSGLEQDFRGVGIRERILLAAIGASQGVAFYLLAENWPTAPRPAAVFVGLLTLLSVSTAIVHFAWTGAHHTRLAVAAITIGAVYAGAAFWVGWQLPAKEEAFAGDDARAYTWALASLTTVYVLGPFLQIFQRTGRRRFRYEDLFRHSWNNFFIALVGLLFVGSLWTVLLLWARLFELVGIAFFDDLFSEEIFIFTLTGAAAGYGVALGRESERVVGTLRTLTLTVFRSLLPLTSFVALLFLATLPFTGLEPLWDTRHASEILLFWLALTILFLNAVYQGGTGEPPRPVALRRLIEAGLIAMTAYAAISAYGIGLRTLQYGLTPGRFYAALFAAVLGLYAVGYAAAVLRPRGPWLGGLRSVNRAVALAVIALGLLVHTPLLDPLGWSARQQFTRLSSGRVAADEFDYGFLRFHLGRAGAAKLAALEGLEQHPEIAEIRAGVARARAADSDRQWRQEHAPGLRQEDLALLPPGAVWPEGLFQAIRGATVAWMQDRCRLEGECVVAPVDLDGRPGLEYVVLIGSEKSGELRLFARDGDAPWRAVGQLFDPNRPHLLHLDEVREALRTGAIGAAEPRYPDVMIDGVRYRLSRP